MSKLVGRELLFIPSWKITCPLSNKALLIITLILWMVSGIRNEQLSGKKILSCLKCLERVFSVENFYWRFVHILVLIQGRIIMEAHILMKVDWAKEKYIMVTLLPCSADECFAIHQMLRRKTPIILLSCYQQYSKQWFICIIKYWLWILKVCKHISLLSWSHQHLLPIHYSQTTLTHKISSTSTLALFELSQMDTQGVPHYYRQTLICTHQGHTYKPLSQPSSVIAKPHQCAQLTSTICPWPTIQVQ